MCEQLQSSFGQERASIYLQRVRGESCSLVLRSLSILFPSCCGLQRKGCLTGYHPTEALSAYSQATMMFKLVYFCFLVHIMLKKLKCHYGLWRAVSKCQLFLHHIYTVIDENWSTLPSDLRFIWTKEKNFITGHPWRLWRTSNGT